MGYTITDYFETNRHLAESILEAERLKEIAASKKNIQEAEKELEMAIEKVDELIEIFTWETTDTDNIRIAFIKNAAQIEDQLKLIRQCGLHPDPYNGTANKFKLVEEIIDSFRVSLSTNGGEVTIVTIKTITGNWKHDGLLAYVRDMQRQLNNTTFDNLLEALRYFEKSSTMLGMFFKILNDEGLLK